MGAVFRRSRRIGYIRQLILLSALPLAIASTGYALFSRSLSIGSTTIKPAYSANQYLYLTYTKTETPSGSNTAYSLNPMTVTNKGVTSVTAWTVKFDVPADVTTVTCSTVVTCTKVGSTVTAVNKAANGTIAAGGSTTFTVSFTSATAKYTLQNVNISGTFSTAYTTIPGLTITTGTRTVTRAGSTYTYAYPFTVTNTSGQTLSAWQAVCTWTSRPTTTTVDTTVNYVTAASSITFSSKTALNNTASLTFNGTFVIRSSTWTVNTCTVQGRA